MDQYIMNQHSVTVFMFTLCKLSSLQQKPTHPVYNIGPEKVAQAVMHFLKLSVPRIKTNSN